MNKHDKTNIKMIILDLDGTLLRSDKTISDYTISILERCKQKDIVIVIATGRSEMSAKHYIDMVKPDGIVSNGGSLARYGGEIIYKSMLSAKISDEIITDLMCKKEFISIRLETEAGYYETYKEVDYPGSKYAIHHDFQSPLSQDTLKIVAELTCGEVAKEIEEIYPECSMIPFSDEEWYRFANKDSDKMNAIEEIAQSFNIDISQMISFGDDYNDIKMIKYCGIGVAMGNAIDEVKNVANYICDTNDNDGVAKWLEKYVLKDKDN